MKCPRCKTEMRILVTGDKGFVGKNLIVRLGELDGFDPIGFDRSMDIAALPGLVAQADAVIHLAGENRPADEAQFDVVNAGLTRALTDAIRASGKSIPILFASSAHALRDTSYGRSKRAGEMAIETLVAETGNPATIYRLPNLFGKWCRPNYNSAVATFCSNIANGLPIRIDDPEVELRLVYIDDLVEELIAALRRGDEGLTWGQVTPEYAITVGALADQIRAFADSIGTLVTERVGTGLTRALYATYISYLPPSRFTYEVPKYGDPRGVFVEMLKTPDAGQFSFFTAYPGITRGGHYHHTKTEKFLVIKGDARFRFRHILTDEQYELVTNGDVPTIVETIPGWSHDITNIGDSEMIVMLWANEIFDRQKPDTIASPVF